MSLQNSSFSCFPFFFCNLQVKIFEMMRKAVSGDLSDIFALVNKAYKVEIGISGHAFKSADRYRSLAEAQKDLEWMYVYESPQIIGVVKAQVDENGVVEIGPIAVDETHQGQGVGTALLKFAESLAPVSRIGCVSCRTDLIPFYAKRGYIKVEHAPIKNFVDSEPSLENVTRNDITMIIMETGLKSK